MGIYEDLGLRPVINGYATVTRLGGSLMPAAGGGGDDRSVPAIRGPGRPASGGGPAHCRTHPQRGRLRLQRRRCRPDVGNSRLRRRHRPGNDCSSATPTERVPGARCEVIFQRCQRSGYDYAVRQVGVDMIEIGPEQSSPADFPAVRRELEQALSERTAAVLYFARGEDHGGGLPLAEVVAAAHARGVPVIVDAAAQLPPVENLWRFSQEGADLVIFSGGKGLCGPQATGLVLGRPDLIKACAVQGNPNQAIGRPMKVGKEELCGCLAAVEWYVGLDHAALTGRFEAQVATVVERLAGRPGVTGRVEMPSEAGQPLPRALLRFDAAVWQDRAAIRSWIS